MATGRLEWTAKKGLHGIFARATAQTDGVLIHLPNCIKQHFINNPNNDYYSSIWYRYTRAPLDTVSALFAAGGSAGAGAFTANYLFIHGVHDSSPGSGPKMIGKRMANAVTGAALASGTGVYQDLNPQFRNVAENEYTQSTGLPTTLSNMRAWWKFGPGDSYSSLEVNKIGSWIIYRTYIEDLTVSGRTYAEVDAIDFAMARAAFGPGGRYADDTFSNPATVYP